MRACLLIALFSGPACSGNSEPDAPKPAPPALTCAEGLELDAPACVSTSEPCAGGACGPTSCADGFELAEEGGCRAILPEGACARGLIAVPGDTACRAIDSCSEGTFGDIPDDPGTLYVDGAAVAPHDGSRARPFRTINEAVGRKPATIAIAAGTYVEDLVFNDPVSLRGRCPSLVTLRSSSGAPDKYALTFLADARVRGISVTGAARGAITAAASLTIERVDLHDLTGRGVSFFPTRADAVLTVNMARIDSAELVGLVGRGKMLVERSVIQNVSLAGDDAIGVQVSADDSTSGDLTLDHVLIEGVAGAGLDVVGARAVVKSVVIRDVRLGVDRAAAIDVRPNPMALSLQPSATFAGLVIGRASGRGIGVSGGKAVIEELTIRDLRAVEGRGGAGLSVFGDVVVSVHHALIDRAAFAGVLVYGGEVRISSSTIRRTAVAEGLGAGILARDVAGPFRLHVLGSSISDNERVGIAIGGGESLIEGSYVARNRELGISLESARARISSSVVEDTFPAGDGSRGVGITVTRFRDATLGPAANVVIERSLVRRCAAGGISVFASNATISDSRIEDIVPEVRTQSAGVGILADAHTGVFEPARVTVERTRVLRVHAAGIVGLGAELTIDRTLVSDVNALAGTFGDGIVVRASEVGSEVLGGSATITSSRIDRAARAGIAVFGSVASISGTSVNCAAFSMNIENAFGAIRRERAAKFNDNGGNICGCGVQAQCKATSSGLVPSPNAR
jgi:hypothetical protein